MCVTTTTFEPVSTSIRKSLSCSIVSLSSCSDDEVVTKPLRVTGVRGVIVLLSSNFAFFAALVR